jgi:2-keto-3-deoxy-L-rhamnonate aldolase RhmA
MTGKEMKTRLAKGDILVGTMVRMIRDPGIVEVCKAAGYDFILVDMEHGTRSIETICDILGRARSAGLPAIVRTPKRQGFIMSWVVDAGATGVMQPCTNNPEDAKYLVEAIKYPPIGNRGFGSMQPCTGYSGTKAREVMPAMNEQVIAVAQIETVEAIENLDEIAAVPGIDALIAGPFDLSISMGIPDQTGDERMIRAMEKIITVAKKHGKISGTHMGNPATVKDWANRGMQLVACSTDVALYYSASRDIVNAVRQN